MQAQADESKAAISRNYEDQRALLLDFSSNFPYTLRLALDYKRREIWIAGHRPAIEEVKYPDGRNYSATLELYELKLEKYHERKSAYAFAAQIQATFDEPVTTDLASQLSEAMLKFQGATGDDAAVVVRRNYILIEDLYQNLIRAMGGELRK